MSRTELILLALEESPALQLMERALRALGYQTVTASQPDGLDKTLAEATPALVLLGESLKDRDGIQIAAELLERFPTLPILLYTGSDSPATLKKALHSGVSAVLHPPLHSEEIVNAVQHSLERARRLGDWLRREVKRTTASLEQRVRVTESERARYEAIFASIEDGVIILDEEGRILLVNPAARRAFALGPEPLTGKAVLEIIPHPDLRALLNRSLEDLLKHHYHEINFEDGRVFNAQYTPIEGIGAAITMQEITYLKELDRLKNDFVHTVSHDLRSPLTSVLGYAELIERAGSLNEQQQSFLQRIQRSVQDITALVNDLLDIGRLEAGFDTRREHVQLEGILRYTLDTLHGQINAKKLDVRVEVPAALPPLRANPIRLRQMLDNLINNAIKYTPEGGEIQVAIEMEDHQIILQVTNSGPGIPPAEQSRVFDKFFRGSNIPPDVTGSGLGLAIVKSIVESHQGRVWVESTPGRGTSFFVVLPVHEAAT